MLAKKLRASRKDIEAAVKNGKNIPGDYFYAKISGNSLNKAGFAIIVSKKTEKTSVGRHLIKRRASAVIESFLNKIKPGFVKTAVFFSKKSVKEISQADIKKDIEDIAKRGGII